MVQEIEGLLNIFDIVPIARFPLCVKVKTVEWLREAIDASTSHPVLHVHIVDSEDVAILLRCTL